MRHIPAFLASFATGVVMLLVTSGCPNIPRDEHPERSPRPSPSEHVLQTGRQK